MKKLIKLIKTKLNTSTVKAHSKHVLWSFFGQATSLGFSFITSLIAANIIDPSIFGTYKYLLSTASLISLFVMPGINGAVTQSVVRGYEGTVGYIMKKCFKLGVLSTLLSITLGLYNLYSGNIEIGYGLIFVSVFLPFSEMLFLYDSILSGKKLYKLSSTLNVISSIATSLCLILSMYFIRTPTALLMSFYVSRTITRYISYLYVKNKYVSNNEIDTEAFKFGIHLSVIKVLRSIATNSSSLFLFNIVGSTSLAANTFISMPVDLIKTLFSSVENVAFTKFSEKNWKTPKPSIFYKKLSPVIILMVVITVFYVFVANTLFNIAFPQYKEYANLSIIYSLSITPSIITMLLLSTVRGGKNTTALHTNNAFNIICIFLTIPIIYKTGLLGLVYFSTSIRFIEFILQHFLTFNNKK